MGLPPLEVDPEVGEERPHVRIDLAGLRLPKSGHSLKQPIRFSRIKDE